MKYIKTKQAEYVLDDGENVNDLGHCELKEAKKIAKKTARENKKQVFILKIIGYIDPEN